MGHFTDQVAAKIHKNKAEGADKVRVLLLLRPHLIGINMLLLIGGDPGSAFRRYELCSEDDHDTASHLPAVMSLSPSSRVSWTPKAPC